MDSIGGSPLSLGLATAATITALYAIYCRLLPKPIPGISHNEAAARSLLGDIPSMIKGAGDESLLDWLTAHARRSPGPLSQLFIQPFGKPFLLLADYREAQDIFLRRSADWDRSDWSIEALGGAAPNHHINIKFGPTWKAHRRLVQDLMTPNFLHTVAAPNIYKSVLNLIELWDIKMRATRGLPFDFSQDISFTAMDAVTEFTFGPAVSHRTLVPQLQLAKDLTEETMGRARDEAGDNGAVNFPSHPIHEFFQSILHTCKCIGDSFNYPRPRWMWWIKRFQPSEIAITKLRHTFVDAQIAMGVNRLQARKRGVDNDYDSFRSAIDLMLDRETKFAEKEGRDPVYHSPTMSDEITGFLVAGHDTTSTTLMWGLKFIIDAPAVQTELRKALRDAHATAVAESRQPSAHEISHTKVPYLDAVIEELLRLAGTIPVLDRQANRDTTLLGHFIPKGTTLVILGLGPTVSEPGHHVEEGLRSPSCQNAAKERGIRSWNLEDMGAFRPDRWLVERDGHVEYDSTAGPTLPFGDGLRGCFGRRLAYLEIKIVVTLIVWNYEMLRAPAELSGYKAVDELTRRPKQCYLRLRKISS